MSEPTTAEERATVRRWAAQGYFLMLGTSRGLGLVSRLLDDYDRLAAERDRYRAALERIAAGADDPYSLVGFYLEWHKGWEQFADTVGEMAHGALAPEGNTDAR